VIGSKSSSTSKSTTVPPYVTPSSQPTPKPEDVETEDDDTLSPALQAWLDGFEFFHSHSKGSKK